MVDFSKRQAASTTEAVNQILCPLLDDAISAHAKAEYEATRGSGEGEVAKKRIGSGYIGTECLRELAFRYHKHPKEDRPSSVSKGELQRHAEAGHWTEAKTTEWFKMIGLEVQTQAKDKDGNYLFKVDGTPKQIGWTAAFTLGPRPQAQMAGEVDGVIVGINNAALADMISVPCIWESKKATDKKWKKFNKEGVKKADPRYYGQLQTNMAYMNVKQTLFSMLNLDTMKFFFEIVPFDQADAQALSDRAVRVLESGTPFELPRLGRAEDDFVCRYCDFHGQCWKGLVLLDRQQNTVQPHMMEALGKLALETAKAPAIFNPNFPVT